MNMKLIIKLIALALLAATLFGLCSCSPVEKKDETKETGATDEGGKGDKNEKPESSEDSVTETIENPYKDIDPEASEQLTVKIIDKDKNPIPGVTVQVFGEGVCHKVVSDENGCAVFGKDLFKGIYAGFMLSLEACPEGYEFDFVGDTKLRLPKGVEEFVVELATKD